LDILDGALEEKKLVQSALAQIGLNIVMRQIDQAAPQMSDEFASGIAKASSLIQRFTYPLLRFDDRGVPDVFASCVFIDVAGAIYLVTAAHALRGNSVGLLTRGKGRLFQVAGRGTVSRAEGGDHFDIGAVCVDDRAVREHEIQYVSSVMFSSSIVASNPHSRAICGFPASMNKQARSLERRTKTFIGKCYTYFGFAMYQGDFAVFGKSPTVHIGLDYLPGKDDGGRTLTSLPSPRGVSGGGAWLVPDLNRPDVVFLEGIFIECHPPRKPRYGFSTRIEQVIQFIKQTHNNGLHRTAANHSED
jgi:hypothetical protein